jgi:hypothetical protein
MQDSADFAVGEIQSVLSRFMNSFDLKDWAQMRSTLATVLSVDYSSFRGEEPHQLSADDYVSARKCALEPLMTQHLLSNLDIRPTDDIASAEATCMIFRSNGEEYFDSHAFYRFELARGSSGWRLTSITQRILWNEGNPKLHAGVSCDA